MTAEKMISELKKAVADKIHRPAIFEEARIQLENNRYPKAQAKEIKILMTTMKLGATKRDAFPGWGQGPTKSMRDSLLEHIKEDLRRPGRVFPIYPEHLRTYDR